MIGEGAGCLVLEELEHALRRDARIYAELAGVGISSDAFHMTAPDETGESQARAMRSALARPACEPAEVDYVNAHGTATTAGDIAETKAIKAAFGDHAADVAISSNKSMIGHLPRRVRRDRGGRHRPQRREQPGTADDQPHRP